ncbi:Diterpene cyclase eriG-like protein [Cladobotryum mycophilum]|uniref:Diterpene cyclase eriG-like protein n=1 Tax=Cladobotryum mycophilum TaxID=491253 RepID=A0ABR0SPC1_9HYPO
MFLPPKQKLSTWAIQVPSLIWAFTESDFFTFVIPNSAFGILGAFAASSFSEGVQPSVIDVLRRIPLIIIYNWSNLLSFDLANQRAPESVAEDCINKPWRPLPMGKITSDQTRRAMLASVPLTLWLNHGLGVWEQGVAIHIGTWLYNDLRGMDEIFVREVLISVAYAMFNSGSLQIALGPEASISRNGIIWIAIISGLVLTTMQIQDLKDQEGDKLRGRNTIVLFLGDKVSRRSIAFFVCFWSLVCAFFCSLSAWQCIIPVLPAVLIAWRVLMMRSQKEDRRSWHLWCAWLVCLYSLPIIGRALLSVGQYA